MPKKIPKDQAKVDKIYCKSVAESISNIIRFSLNDEFRKESFELFGVASTKEVEKDVNKRLNLIVERRNIEYETDKRKKRRTDLASNENLEEPKLSENAPTNLLTISHKNSQLANLTVSPNLQQRNWLKISSEKYKENIKQLRKKGFKSYSQPQFSQWSNESSKSDWSISSFYSHNSLPVSFASDVSFTSSQETTNCSPELMEEDDNFYKFTFKDTSQGF